MPLGELAAQFNLGSELLMSVVTPRMNKTIHGRLEGGLLYTSAYIARIKAQVRLLLAGWFVAFVVLRLHQCCLSTDSASSFASMLYCVHCVCVRRSLLDEVA